MWVFTCKSVCIIRKLIRQWIFKNQEVVYIQHIEKEIEMPQENLDEK